jgi:hypothetical protein
MTMDVSVGRPTPLMFSLHKLVDHAYAFLRVILSKQRIYCSWRPCRPRGLRQRGLAYTCIRTKPVSIDKTHVQHPCLRVRRMRQNSQLDMVIGRPYRGPWLYMHMKYNTVSEYVSIER